MALGFERHRNFFWTGARENFGSAESLEENSIAFGSAPQREAGSRPISQLVRQAVSETVSRASRQADRNTQFRFLFSVAGLASCSGEDTGCQNKPQSNGNAAGRTLESRRFEASEKLTTGYRTANLSISGRLHYHSTGACSASPCSPHCLKPSDQKPLTPPSPHTHPHPPPKKCCPVSGDRGLRIKKSIGGLSHWTNVMILQGVRRQKPCLGVCYTNDPKKGGYTTPVPALDLTTSLRGDLFQSFEGLPSPHGTPRHRTAPHLTSPKLPSPPLPCPPLPSPRLASPHLTSPHLPSPHFASPGGSMLRAPCLLPVGGGFKGILRPKTRSMPIFCFLGRILPKLVL